MDPSRIVDAFPAPEYRGNQAAALDRIRDAFDSGKDVVLVRAPTGSGKSLLARAIAGCARPGSQASATEAIGAYYTTPQVSQLDDVAADSLLSDLAIVRGKSNYKCILPGETDTPVNGAPCVREREFNCEVKHRCPYFSDREIAANQSIAAMTLAYFMQTAGSDVFGTRDVVVIDEAHGLGEWAEMYASIELSPDTVPVFDERPPPAIDDLDTAADYAAGLARTCDRRLTDLRSQAELDPDEAQERDRLTELQSDLSWFREEYRDPESPTTWVLDQPDGEGTRVTIKPLNPERYLTHTVWDRGNKFALLSATILNKEAFCASVGLDPDRVALVSLDHTFPVENRPLFDVTQGKMTYGHRETTTPMVAETLLALMGRHPKEKGLVHCHSYAIQNELADHLDSLGVDRRVRSHDSEDRDGQLAAWKRSDDPEVFLSVKMEEALDLEGDLCRWQLLCKAPYPNTRDSRVARRLEDGAWAWYYRTALRTVIQACGRIIRAPDDHGATYLADSSLLDLFERARSDMPGWFQEQVDRMGHPTLPDPDPDAALSGLGVNGSSGGSGRSGSSGSRRSRRNSRSGSNPVADVWDTE
ncbi:helicase C-terminal domain-containing protein [Halorhabdus sp. CUG00001]|uniref:helicase C-terminal domain-containing protein n=1 Tax=Halorhabdus sp. CUG00001 TaxID=2600297 RepID=UPI00131E7BD7|nr:ATP-dependent DNA helicase [Halorhabdus sp. CUG00001]